jgi:hypothetical protein
MRWHRKQMIGSPIPERVMSRRDPVFKDRLILGNDQSHFPIGKQRIASISKEVMGESGINTDIYKSHSIRGATATKQIDLGEDVEDVMFRGRWRSWSTFKKFYERAHKRMQMNSKLFSAMLGSF